MKHIDIKQSWNYIVLLTQTMEQKAAEEDWAEVAQIAGDRHKTIQAHFTLFPVGPDTATFYYQHLSNFLSKEEQLQKLTNNARKQIMKQNMTLISNKKAAGAYHSFSKL